MSDRCEVMIVNAIYELSPFVKSEYHVIHMKLSPRDKYYIVSRDTAAMYLRWERDKLRRRKPYGPVADAEPDTSGPNST